MADDNPGAKPDESTPAPAGQPAATPAPPAAAKPPVLASDLPDDALKARLDRAEKAARDKTLAEAAEQLGVDLETAKSIIAAHKAGEEAKKGIEQKLGETSKTLESTQAELKRAREANKEYATRQMMGLSQERQDAVLALVDNKEDHAGILRAIAVLTPTWAPKEEPGTPDKGGKAPPPAAAPPASTAPSRDAPSGTSVSPPDHSKVYASLVNSNPFAAAQYAEQHAADIWPEQRT